MSAPRQCPVCGIPNGAYEQLEAQLRQEREDMRFFRARVFGPRTHNPGCHNTACTIWGDDGQGSTVENYPQPLPCTCGCLKDWAEAQAAHLQARVKELVDTLTRIASFGASCSCPLIARAALSRVPKELR